MTRISRKQLNQKQLEKIKEHFSYLISYLNKKPEIESFFDEFLTKEEKIMLTKRLVLFIMLKKNFSPSATQLALNVSYETVRTYQNQLRYKTPQFHEIIEKLLKRDKIISFFREVERLVRPVKLAVQTKTNMKARAKFASGQWD